MSDLSAYRILIVDDEPDAREFLRTVLTDENASVIEAKDGIVTVPEEPGLLHFPDPGS